MADDLRRKQAMGALGAAAAFATCLLVWRFAPLLFASVTLPPEDAGARLGFAAHWLLLPGMTLLAGILGASRRGFYADAIEGTRSPASYSLEINLRYNTNTVEQVALAAIAWLGLSQTLAHDALILIPAMALLFVAGRITFWIGYALHPMARTFGIALTALPTLAGYAFLGWRFVGGG